jgi:glutathione S-transferase
VVQVYRIPFSTNVERVALAAGHKGIELAWIDVDAGDRSEVVRVSGQELVPVLVDGDEVLADSPAILRLLEDRFPEPPLWPAGEAERAHADLFVEWFNHVWKGPPNRIAAEEAAAGDAESLARWNELFESLLAGRDFLLGEFGIADVIAFPFLKYALLPLEPGDTDAFHVVLAEHLVAGPRLAAWIRRVDARPRA